VRTRADEFYDPTVEFARCMDCQTTIPGQHIRCEACWQARGGREEIYCNKAPGCPTLVAIRTPADLWSPLDTGYRENGVGRLIVRCTSCGKRNRIKYDTRVGTNGQTETRGR